jgi:ABC-type polysaccharide/polyol phosphate export permease
MFSTPIFYPATLLADKKLGRISASLVLDLNPMYWLVDSYQRVMLYGLWPQWHLLGRFALVALVVFALGSRFLMREKRSFPDLL